MFVAEKSKSAIITLLAILLVSSSNIAVAEEDRKVGYHSLFSDGKTSFDFRYRYETVDADSAQKDAHASTLRSRITFESGNYEGLTFLVEIDDITTLGNDTFNSTTNRKSEYAVVADPEGTEINQAYLSYALGDAKASYGRQRIVHGSERFIGGVAWRQNEQTYDGFRTEYVNDAGFGFDYAYVHNVNRLFGPDDGPVQPADHRGDSHFLRIDYKLTKEHSLSVFGYLLDIDQDDNYAAGKTVGNSSNTYGLKYMGKIGAATLKAAYATQTDAGNSVLNYDTDYYLIEIGYAFENLKVKLGLEELGSDSGVGFKTPYATLHKFQGWADLFLVTPADGIEDLYLGVTGSIGAVKIGAFYHDFSADSSGTDFGSELDLVASWSASSHLSFQLKGASFRSDDEVRFPDTNKLWLTARLKF